VTLLHPQGWRILKTVIKTWKIIFKSRVAFSGICGGCGARPNAEDSRSSPEEKPKGFSDGFRRFEKTRKSGPPHNRIRHS